MPYRKGPYIHEYERYAPVSDDRRAKNGQKQQEQVDAFKKEWVPKVGAEVIAEGYSGVCRVLSVLKGSANIEYFDRKKRSFKNIDVRITSLSPWRGKKPK